MKYSITNNLDSDLLDLGILPMAIIELVDKTNNVVGKIKNIGILLDLSKALNTIDNTSKHT